LAALLNDEDTIAATPNRLANNFFPIDTLH